MKKNTSLNIKVNRILIIPILILSLSAITYADLDFCTVTKPYDTIGLLKDESLSLTLGDYIRGYNLDFTSTKAINARPSDPLNTVGSVEFNLKQGYNVINADVNKCNCGRWFQEGVVFSQKDTKNIGLALTKFTGTRTVADVLQQQYYTLDVPAVCFSARIVDSQYNVVLDCQTLDPNDQSDYLCFISTKDKKVKSCLQLDSLNDVKDRKSEIFALGDEMYLATASYARTKDSTEMSYLTIYHIDTVKGSIEFVNIIDGYQLGLDYEIVISDFQVKLGGKIYIHDMTKSQILTVKYTKDNQVSLVQKPWVYGSEGVEFQISNVNTVLIATGSYVQEYDLTIKARVFRYQLPILDNQVNSISVSTYGVVITTQRNNLYVYQRIMTPANYILGSLPLKEKKFLLSPYANILYTFTQKQYELVQMTSGALSLTGITQTQNITITAQSATSKCSFTLEIIALESSSKILTKQNIAQKQFVTQTSQQLNFNLQEIFSGQNLRYNVPQSTDQIKYSLQQLNQYTVETGLTNAVLKQIVGLDKSSFLQIGVWSTQVYVELCTADDDNMKIVCKCIYFYRLYAQNPNVLSAKLRKSGQVIFVWGTSQGQYQTLYYIDGKIRRGGYFIDGTTFEYSSILIAEDKIYFTLKKYGIINIYNDLQGGYVTLNAKSFAVMNPELVGFYPRQIYLHPRNAELIYVKFPQHICLMTIFGTLPKAIDCVKVLEKIIPEQQWTVIVGMQTYVVITPYQVAEYSILGNNNTLLHTVSTPKVTFPVYYNQFLNTIVMRTSINQIIYYKLNKPLIDCIYYESPLKASSQLLEGEQLIAADGYWSVNGFSTKAYRQSYNTKLTIQTIGDMSFKQDLNISISVKGKQQQIDINDNITVINYRTQINVQNVTNDVVRLSNNAESIIRVPVNISQYMTGPKANYHIVCDYCDDTIKLQTFYKNRSANTQIKGSTRSIIEVLQQKYIVILTTDNILYLLNKDQQLSIIVSLKIQGNKECYEMGWNGKLGLMVFCADVITGQEMLHFIVSETSIVQWPGSFQLHQQSMITSISQIIIVHITSAPLQQSFWLLIHDNDASSSSLSKTSNIKLFLITKDLFAFKGVIDSSVFSDKVNQPINDVQVQGKMVMVTIGNYGVGYGWLADQAGDIVMGSMGSIQLRSINQVKAKLLDNSIFQQVDILSMSTDSTSLSVLITSTTSIPMVVQLTNTNFVLSFNKITQTYNRYGLLDTINWHAVNDNVLLLKYYNTNTFEQYIVGYNRTENVGMGDFVESLTRKVAMKKAVQNTVLLTKQSGLIISEVPEANVGSQLARYDVSAQFNLLLTYSQPGDFSKITLTASNAYSSSNIDIAVQFDHNKTDDQGVKWYTIFIIILIVAIICGIAYGMYLKMIKNRKDKKVSLLTEGEEVDEQI